MMTEFLARLHPKETGPDQHVQDDAMTRDRVTRDSREWHERKKLSFPS